METLERRDTPSGLDTTTPLGTPWADANALTLSFARDDTVIGGGDSKPEGISKLPPHLQATATGGTSRLFELMKKVGGSQEWQREVLRAFQTWAARTNANVAVVPDEGQAFGTVGDLQGDNRFGDIRIGATALSADSLANAVPNDPRVGTWSGDVLFNALKKFTLDPDRPSDGYDVFTTALHEAGHVFGQDHSDDPASAMTETYTGRKTGLTAGDVAGVQAVYGVRQADEFEGAVGNDTFATATALSREAYQQLVGDLTTVGDADVFAFTVPAKSKDAAVTLRTVGVSAVAATIEVYDSAGNLVARSKASDPLGGKDATIDLPDSKKADVRYFARVSSPNADVFAIGRYLLTVNVKKEKANGSEAAVLDGRTNDTLAAATTLAPDGQGNDDRYRITAALEGKGDVDAYRLTAPVVPAEDALQIEVRNLKGDRTAPQVQVFDAAGNPQVVQVLESGKFKTTLQVLGISRGATYYVVVRSPAGVDATGDYRLTADFGAPVVRGLTELDSGMVSAYVPEAEGTLELDSARLVQLSLNVASSDLANSTVALQVFDADDKLLGEWGVNPLTGQVNGSLLLEAGTYRIVVSVQAKKGQTPPPVRYWLFGAVSSDPIGPTVPTTGTLPTSPPPPPPPPPSYTFTGGTTTTKVGYAYKS